MAGPYDPLLPGFKGLSELVPVGTPGHSHPLMYRKQSGNAVLRKGHLLITAAGGTCDIVATTGTNEVQTLTPSGTISGGTWSITFNGQTTALLAYNATAAQVQAALQALSTVGVDNITVTGGPLTSGAFTLTFVNELSGTNVPAVTVTNNLTGTTPAVAVATATAGVLGKVTSTTLLGICDESPTGTIQSWPKHFARPENLNLDGVMHTDTKDIKIYPLRNRVFEANIEWNVAVANSMIDTSVSIGYNLTTNSFFVLSGDTSTPLVKIIGVRPDQLGVVGGKVEFIFLSTVIADV